MANLSEKKRAAKEAADAVVAFSLKLAAERMKSDPADPGWQLEVMEDSLEDAIIDAATAIEAVKEARRRGHIDDLATGSREDEWISPLRGKRAADRIRNITAQIRVDYDDNREDLFWEDELFSIAHYLDGVGRREWERNR